MPAISVLDLRKTYDDTEAVRGVSFEIRAGEVFCLLGPNGAGKTTTTEILEGYRLPTTGEVRVLGHDPARGERALRECLGIVPQTGGLQPGLSVAEMLEMYARPYRRPLPVDEVLDLVELGERRDVRTEALSGGQRRRLDLALALIGDPDVLFLDEPTTGFDPAARRQAWTTIRALCDLGKTVFLTTHFMDEAHFLADTVAVMVGGRLVATGSPAELTGRTRRPAEITFRLPDDLVVADLPRLEGATVAPRPEGVLVTTAAPVAIAHRLTGWALERGVDLAGFAVTHPSLEDVYLDLTTAPAFEEALR